MPNNYFKRPNSAINTQGNLAKSISGQFVWHKVIPKVYEDGSIRADLKSCQKEAD